MYALQFVFIANPPAKPNKDRCYATAPTARILYCLIKTCRCIGNRQGVMRYTITDFQFKKDKNNKTYLSLKVSNPDDWFDMTNTTVCLFGEQAERYYKAVGGDQTKWESLPEPAKSFANAYFVVVDAPAPMYHLCSADFNGPKVALPGSNGLYVIADKSGLPKIYTSVRVLCKKSVDNESGELDWATGWDPNTRASQMFGSLFVRAQIESAPATITDETPAGSEPADSASGPAF